MNLLDVFTIVMTTCGLFFFLAGSIGLLRFPDVFCRLHALTKADNLGLGLIVFGVLPQTASVFDAVQLILIWLLVMVAGAVGCYLIAQQAVGDLSKDAESQSTKGHGLAIPSTIRPAVKPASSSPTGSTHNVF
ncbi:MAG: multicomponent Na+:H+ antiporter subunit G [Candidatus Endobugula sp.]|jgi:multicomponent Na+:H+ antiporter subunit G